MNLEQQLEEQEDIGWIDIPALKYAININGVTQLMMMKADVLTGIDNIKACTHYLYNKKKN